VNVQNLRLPSCCCTDSNWLLETEGFHRFKQALTTSLLPRHILDALIHLRVTSSPDMSSQSHSKIDDKAKELMDASPSCFTDTNGVITSTMNDIPGYRVVKVLGAIYGITVRSRNWGADIGAFLKSIVGGEIRYFTNLMYTSRNAAVERMVGECLQRGGNAIIALRFDQAEVNALRIG